MFRRIVSAMVLLGVLANAPASAQDAPAPTIAPIVVSGIVEAPISKVWHAWTTDEGLRAFLVEGSKVELRPGGPYEIYFSMAAPEGSRGSETCKVLSYIPVKMLSFEWNAPPKFEHARFIHTWVVVELSELSPTRTRVELTHLGFAERAAENPDHRAEWEEVRAYFTNAWPFVLDALKSHFAPPADDQPGSADRALEVCRRFVGGEWVHEAAGTNGGSFRVRNVIRPYAGGRAFECDGWLGTEKGMYYHASTTMWVDTEADALRFHSVNQDAEVMRGTLEAVDDHTLLERIEILAPGQEPAHIDARITFIDENHYTMGLERDGVSTGPSFTITRVDKAPVKLRTLIDGTIVD